ncbi:MAG: PIN domain-containing protein, partial [Angustibacter sp.]
LIDTSALARLRYPAVAEIIAEMIIDRTAATCITVDLEVGYSARNFAELTDSQKYRLASYHQLSIRPEIANIAQKTQQLMAGSGHHRAAGVVDILTAAIAEFYGAVIVHYDADFEHIAAATGQAQRWIAPRGTLA